MSTYQAREPKGRPTGGQFAATPRPSGTVNLTATESPEQAALVLGYAQEAARYWCRRLDIQDTDEITGRALLAYLTQGAPNGVRNLRGYVHCLARGVAMAHLSGDNRGIRRARAVLADAVEEWAQANQRWPNAAERAEIAAEVRLRFPANRRPPTNYISREVTSLKLSHDDSNDAEPPGTVMWASNVGEPGVVEDGATSSPTEDTLDRVEAATAGATNAAAKRAAKAKFRTEAWAALAPQGPSTRPLAPKQAAQARQRLKLAGGVAKAVSAWQAGTADEGLAEALFAPFDAPGTKSRATVAAILSRHRAYAADLWEAALYSALQRSSEQPCRTGQP
jgi:hypothetical protein